MVALNRRGSGFVMNFVDFRGVAPRILVLTALTSYVSQMFGALQSWPLWAMVVVTVLPWIPLLTSHMTWAHKHYHWFALLYLTAVGQFGRFFLHGVLTYQTLVLNQASVQAPSFHSAMGGEGAHFLWSAIILVANALLVVHFRRNPWLWISLAFTTWHQIEHCYILYRFVRTGLENGPGLLGEGGLLFGGLPLSRSILHVGYNTLETLPLLVGFGVQLRRSYNKWLAKALPTLSVDLLASATNKMQIMRFRAGQTVMRQGDQPDCMYVITDGEADVVRTIADGTERLVATLRPGQLFGEIGLLTGKPRIATITAKTNLEVLALGQTSFRRIIDQSDATAQSLWELAEVRRAEATTYEPVGRKQS